MDCLTSPINPAPKIIIENKYELCINQFYQCDWCSIFNTPEFFNLHQTGNGFYFQLCVGNPLQPIGVVHFTPVEPTHFRSPRRGTFGSFEFRNPLRMEVIEKFVAEVERFLAAKGALSIEILEPPAMMDSSQAAVLYNIFCRNGYEIQPPELDYTLLVDTPSFPEKIEYNLRKRINKCQREGMVARQVDLSLCSQVYNVISENRSAKGFPMTMSCEAIMKMTEVFPGRIVLFAVFAAELMVASSICIKIGRGLLYVFYWGDLPGFDRHSPVSLLAQSIYDFAKINGLTHMGLGTSTVNGVPNYGLVNFKREMGCVESLKLKYVKHLNQHISK